jgi:tape measure domain-containing protein
MGNVLEFYLRMKDMMSGGLIKMAQTAKQSFGVAQNQANSFGRVLDNLVKKIKATDQELLKMEANRRKANAGGGGSSGGLMKNIGIGLAVAGAVAFAKNSVAAAMNYEATTKSFQVLAGTTKGKALAASLNKLQQDTILGPEVFKSAQTLLGFGVAADRVMKIERQLGDVSMGNKDRFEALTLAFSQTQAAGKLMGQDLLQYINAGFNPLQTMSEHWKEFGLKSAASVGQLKDMMEHGKISADAVAKAFEIATGKGGKFANMMDAMAQTSAGKLQILEGQYENFKIQVGNALMPVANDLMTLASKTLDWLDISKTAPQVLMGEHAELTSLLGVITSLNEGNDFRGQLLQQLNAKYPDLFKNIDTEKVKNSDLLTTLKQINDEYGKKISLASSDLIIDTNKKEAQDQLAEYTRLNTIVTLLKRGDAASLQTAAKYRTFGEAVRDQLDRDGTSTLRYYATQAHLAQYHMGVANNVVSNEGKIKESNQFQYTLDDAYNLARDSKRVKELFGTNSKGMDEFMKLAANISKVSENGAYWHYNTHGNGMAFAQQLRDLMSNPNGAEVKKQGTGGDGTLGGGGTSKGIAGGGARTINISGVNFKVADKVTVNNQGDMETMERKLQEMFLRVLNSGASLQ